MGNEADNTIPASSRAVDFIMTSVKGGKHLPLETLEQAKQTPNSIVVLDGDYGGQVYATCPVKHLNSALSHADLETLCQQISALEWGPDQANNMDWQVSYQIKEVGSGVWGGMGGGKVVDGLWLHPQLCSESADLLAKLVEIKNS